MLVRAKVSFAGKISMMRGKEREIADEEVLNDLLKAGYVELIQPAEQPNDNNTDETPDGDKPDEENTDETPSGQPDEKPKRGKKK